MTDEPIWVGVVDDHMVVQDGIRAMAERAPDIEFAGAADDERSALELLGRVRTDLLLLDLLLSEQNSLDICRLLHDRHPDVRILIFSAFGDRDLLEQSVRAGASGYVLKDTSTDTLPAIIRHLVDKGTYFDPRISSDVVRDLYSEDDGPALNDREVEILRLIAAGQGNREIGKALYLSPHTVKFHVGKMMGKLGTRRRAELVRIAVKRGML